jgi:hypothetical protein
MMSAYASGIGEETSVNDDFEIRIHLPKITQNSGESGRGLFCHPCRLRDIFYLQTI